MSVTPDGTAPRMRVGVFTMGTSILTDDRDADYDLQVILHEYGHSVSGRIVGSLTSTSCLDGIQSGAMGEGWSDYFAASYTNNPIMSAYLAGSAGGIRRASYQGYPYFYEDIGNSSYGSEVHDDGEIWAATLWDLRSARKGAPGTILDDRLTIACGAGALWPTWVQRAGKRALESEVFLRGAKLQPGTVLP